MSSPEVVIVGGGPAGSVCATRLAQLGRRVLVLEKEHFPRFHLGESLLPQSLHTLAAIGVLDDVHAQFIHKHGAHFWDDRGGSEKEARFGFENAFETTFGNAYQVPRDEFDNLLLRHAAKSGAEVREGWTVNRVLRDGARAIGVEATDPAGVSHVIDAAFVVDASGRDALVAHANRQTEKIEGLDKTALFAHFRNVPRADGERAGDIDIVLFTGGWFWFIPFKDGRTSVGAVVGSEWLRERKKNLAVATPEALFACAVSESATATRFLASAEQDFAVRATADFSYRVPDWTGDGCLTVGDAGGFIDPLFSTGAHIAMYSGKLAAEAIHDALTEGDVSHARFDAWQAHVRAGAEVFIAAVKSFYQGDLVDFIFAENPHTYLRRAITSLLAGDVFASDARWLRDVKKRLTPTA